MRRFAIALLALAAAGSSVHAGDPQQSLNPAASMDPYSPIRNSALQFDLIGQYDAWSGYYAGSDATKTAGENTGSTKATFSSSAAQTRGALRIKHGFLDGTEAILEIPYVTATGPAQRPDPASTSSGGKGDKRESAGMGDWTMAMKYRHEQWGLGGYFGVVLPVAPFGTDAYQNGDGQLNFGALYNQTFAEKYQVLSNFVFGFDLPASNRRLEHQHNYSFYSRFGYLLSEQRYRPYLAVNFEGYMDYIENNDVVAQPANMLKIVPGIDLTVFGDVSAELAVPVTVMGTGNGAIATPSGWGVQATLKYFWYRY